MAKKRASPLCFLLKDKFPPALRDEYANIGSNRMTGSDENAHGALYPSLREKPNISFGIIAVNMVFISHSC